MLKRYLRRLNRFVGEYPHAFGFVGSIILTVVGLLLASGTLLLGVVQLQMLRIQTEANVNQAQAANTSLLPLFRAVPTLDAKWPFVSKVEIRNERHPVSNIQVRASSAVIAHYHSIGHSDNELRLTDDWEDRKCTFAFDNYFRNEQVTGQASGTVAVFAADQTRLDVLKRIIPDGRVYETVRTAGDSNYEFIMIVPLFIFEILYRSEGKRNAKLFVLTDDGDFSELYSIEPNIRDRLRALNVFILVNHDYPEFASIDNRDSLLRVFRDKKCKFFDPFAEVERQVILPATIR